MYNDYRNEKPKETLLKFILIVNTELRGTNDFFIQLSMAPRMKSDIFKFGRKLARLWLPLIAVRLRASRVKTEPGTVREKYKVAVLIFLPLF